MSAADDARLPMDSDPSELGRPPRAVHLRPRYLAVVFVGGAAGTAAREAVSLTVPALPGLPEIPVTILAINVVGAFLLGLLLEALVRRGPDQGVRRLVRLLLGTGFCGGFTTYSSLATATAVLLAQGAAGAGVLYALGTVLAGAVASWAGIAVGALGRRPT